MDVEAFSRAAGIHPDLVRRLVVLGLIEATTGPNGELRFARDQIAAAARIQRLRSGFALNYAALGLVTNLLDRIAVLEHALRRAHADIHKLSTNTPGTRPPGTNPAGAETRGDRPWT
jgi:hypothetical protein